MELELTDDLDFFEDMDVQDVVTADDIKDDTVTSDEIVTDNVDDVTTDDNTDVAKPDEAAADADDSGIFTSAFDIFKERGIISVPDDYKFEPTEEGFNKALEATAEKIREEVMDALREDLPEEGLALIKYMKSGGKDIAKFKEVYSEPNYETFEASTDDDRKALLKTYYQKTTKWNEAKIEKHLATLEVSGELEESFDEAKTELVTLQKSERDSLQAAAQEQAALRKESEQKAIESLSKVITEKTSINGYPIAKTDIGTVIPFLMKPIKVGERVTTAYNQKHAEIMRDPEKAVLLAKLVQSGLDLSVFGTTQKTTAVRSLKEKLKTAQNFKGTVDTNADDSSWDDLENI